MAFESRACVIHCPYSARVGDQLWSLWLLITESSMLVFYYPFTYSSGFCTFYCCYSVSAAAAAGMKPKAICLRGKREEFTMIYSHQLNSWLAGWWMVVVAVLMEHKPRERWNVNELCESIWELMIRRRFSD